MILLLVPPRQCDFDTPPKSFLMKELANFWIINPPKETVIFGMFGFVCEDFLFFLLVSPLPTKRIHKPQNSTYQKWCFRTRRWRNIQLIWSFRRRVLGFLEENTWSGWVGVSLVGWVGRLVALCCVGWLFWLKPLICYPGCPLTLLASPGLWPGHGAEQGSMHCVKWSVGVGDGMKVALYRCLKQMIYSQKNQFHWEIIM